MTNLEKIKTLDLDSMTDFIYYAKKTVAEKLVLIEMK